jgi:hypothetical protein
MLSSKLALGLTTMLAVGAVPAPAYAQTSSGGATIDIDNCNTKTSRNAGGFTWAYCPVVVQAPLGQNVTVQYSENLALFNPHTNGTWHNRSGTLAFNGGGQQTLNIAFAFKGKKTRSQVAKTLKVTLSNPSGATIVDGTATANPPGVSS